MELMDGVMEYIRPELLVLVAVLYIVGKALKASQDVKDKHIPLILGGAGVFLAMLWVVATGSFDGVQSIALGLFTGIVQGVLVAGCSYYANLLVKQAGRPDGPECKSPSPPPGYPAPGMLFVF